MGYYIQGNAAKAEQIKAAFEDKGYDTTGWKFNVEGGFYYTTERKRIDLACGNFLINLIKTHPDYQELELPAEPKFKVGNWIVRDYDGFTRSIESIKDGEYYFNQGDSFPIKGIDEYYHLWTIADAKDGDVITNGKLIVIFNKLEEPTYKQHIIAYVGLDLCGRLQITEDTWQLGVDKAMPATKEQRRRLFAELKKAGYEWDAYKKELKKIPPHYDILNFHAGMPVLVRDVDCDEWEYVQFSHYRKVGTPFRAGGQYWLQCIPFNDDTKHLLGITDMPDECYINW